VVDDTAIQQQKAHYEDTWRQGLAAGKEQRGNLRLSLQFLEMEELISPEHRVLEIGCGIGSVVAALNEKGIDAIGTDISAAAVEYGRQKYPGIRIEAHPAERLPYDDASFDVVLSFDLFEHIDQTDAHLAEVTRLLKPGGYYLFQTPNKYVNTVWETLSTRSFEWRRYHPSLHSPGQLRKRLARHGLDCRFVKINPINEYALQKLRKALGRVGLIARYVPFDKLPMVLQTNMYVVSCKSQSPST